MYSIKMNKQIITFGDIEIEKHKFNYLRNPSFTEDVNKDKIFTLGIFQ